MSKQNKPSWYGVNCGPLTIARITFTFVCEAFTHISFTGKPFCKIDHSFWTAFWTFRGKFIWELESWSKKSGKPPSTMSKIVDNSSSSSSISSSLAIVGSSTSFGNASILFSLFLALRYSKRFSNCLTFFLLSCLQTKLRESNKDGISSLELFGGSFASTNEWKAFKPSLFERLQQSLNTLNTLVRTSLSRKMHGLASAMFRGCAVSFNLLDLPAYSAFNCVFLTKSFSRSLGPAFSPNNSSSLS